MKVKEFNALKKQVREGNVKGLNKEVISDLTLSQAKELEDAMLDLPLNDKMNKVLDEIVLHIDGLVEAEKVANKKLNKKPEKVKTEKQPKTEKVKTETKTSPFNKVEVGDVVKFQVEGEEVKHDIRIIYKGVNHIVGIMVEDEREVFLIRKQDFNKLIFNWTDRHNEKYNIIVTL